MTESPPTAFADRFLRDPGHFPDGENTPWGEHGLDLQLPASAVRISGLSAKQRDSLAARFAPRLARTAGALAIHLRRLPAERFWDQSRMGRYYDLDIQRDPDATRIAGLGFVARIVETGDVTIWTYLEESARFLEVMENTLRILTAIRVLDQGGVMLHSAGIQLADGAHLFWGHSGAGKSTLSGLALAAGHPVISDDLNVILPGPAGFQVEPVPFAGDLGQTAQPRNPVPLRGLHRLQKAADNRREPLSTARALAGLLGCAPFVNTDPRRLECLQTRLCHLLAEIPTDMVYFSRNEHCWKLFR